MEARAAGSAARAVKKAAFPLFLVFSLLGGCASTPTGPNVLVLPGSAKTFDQFRIDERECRRYAYEQIGGENAKRAAADGVAKGAAVGAVVGTVAGAALGGHEGAGVGAGVGLAAGALAGTGSAEASGHTLQRRYDFAYQQCMYAKGHKIPMARESAPRTPPGAYPPPPPPPPPSG